MWIGGGVQGLGLASSAAKQGAPLAMKGASFSPVSAASSYVATPRPAATIASVAAVICGALTTRPAVRVRVRVGVGVGCIGVGVGF